MLRNDKVNRIWLSAIVIVSVVDPPLTNGRISMNENTVWITFTLVIYFQVRFSHHWDFYYFILFVIKFVLVPCQLICSNNNFNWTSFFCTKFSELYSSVGDTFRSTAKTRNTFVIIYGTILFSVFALNSSVPIILSVVFIVYSMFNLSELCI